MSIESLLKNQPLDSKRFIELSRLVLAAGGSIVKIGVMDDIAPDGSPNTACSQSFARAQSSQQIFVVKDLIAPGIYSQTTFRLNLP